jgi:hypothetical protein
MEEAIRTLQDQANRVEQFLPSLATREELYSVRDQAMRHAAILNEATGDSIKLLAENLARVEAAMATKADLADLEERLSAQITNMAAQITNMAAQIATLAGRRRKSH